ncbi:hypothetical protein TTRE_0000874501 [Trichuris trichiura]|uniref:Uncharacterized protein n=1 Tax=Trichuris trichiura TaxID=36087 RepID=A0A077ZKX6_TRITR|nr:hypothetical protein TTRE_0000874501 [Trichuris trichiura]
MGARSRFSQTTACYSQSSGLRRAFLSIRQAFPSGRQQYSLAMTSNSLLLIESQPKDEEVAIAAVETVVRQALMESTRTLPVTAQLIGEESSEDLILQRVDKISLK